MEIEEIMHRVGGVADRASLVRLTSRREVDRALREGTIVRDGRGCYAVPAAHEALRSANALNGIVSHRSAALLHGWAVKTVPARPDVTVPKNRKVTDRRRAGTTLHRASVAPGDIAGRVTSVRRTLCDCLRTLPFDESLSIADSALRRGSVTKPLLIELAAGIRGTGARSARRVAAAADERAANPFESTLRALALDVPGLNVVPQLTISDVNFSVQPDLVDRQRRVVLEADSFAWHGDRSALRWDAQRYNNLVVRGWLVLRFAWEDVMHDQEYVRRTLTMLAALGDPC
jgi:very-short-patch-repair endonuclease